MTGKQVCFWALFPSLLASAVATVVIVALTGSFFDTLYTFPAYIPRLLDLLLAVPLSLVGGLAGVLFALALRWLRKLMQPLNKHLVLRGLIGGLGMGVIGALSLLLATGWKGGYVFPIMFAGVALGMAGKLLFPDVPTAVTVAATLAGALVAALRAPLFAGLFTLVLMQAETAPVVAVSV
jgi:H+/Cl- antiporter ClcA